MTQLADVLTVGTPEQKLEALLQAFIAKQLSARGWQAKRIAYVLAAIQADASAAGEQLTYDITTGGFLDSAIGPWLDLLAVGWFNEFRNAPRPAIIQLHLADTAGAGPYTVANPIAVAYPSSSQPLYYRSQAGTITVPRNGFADPIFVAESPGAVYNVSPGQITDLSTPIPGVTVTSPQIGTTGVITVQAGQDEEQDGPFRARLRDKWSLLAQGYTVGRIRALTRLALAGRTLRMVVLDPGPIDGVPFEYIADTGGPVSYADALAVYQYLRSPERKPVGNYPVQVYPATTYGGGLLAVSWTLYTDGTNPNALTDCIERLTAYEETIDPGQRVHVSRLVDVAINGASDGVIGAVPVALAGSEFITLGQTDVLEMNLASNTFTVVGP